MRNGKPVGKLEGYSSHLVVDEAARWLSQGRDKAKPFFLYVCFHEPHEPIASDDKYARLYPRNDPSYTAHHGNITQMDDAFGRLMRTLDEQGLRDNTLVLFTSDNGPAITAQHPHGSAGPLRDKKGSVYEGGIRVPGLLRWPGKTKPGSVSDEPICGVDFLPTVCAITGIEPPRDRVLDGASFLPVLSGGTVQRATPLYWHFNRAAGDPRVAMRIGDWKILATLDRNPAPPPNDMTEAEERNFKEAQARQILALQSAQRYRRNERPCRRTAREVRGAEVAARKEVPRGARGVADVARVEVHEYRRKAHRVARLREEESRAAVAFLARRAVLFLVFLGVLVSSWLAFRNNTTRAQRPGETPRRWRAN